jgi:hypothetical protein
MTGLPFGRASPVDLALAEVRHAEATAPAADALALPDAEKSPVVCGRCWGVGGVR